MARISGDWPFISLLWKETLAAQKEVLVSSTIKDLVVGSGIDFKDRSEHELKGVLGSWRLDSVVI